MMLYENCFDPVKLQEFLRMNILSLFGLAGFWSESYFVILSETKNLSFQLPNLEILRVAQNDSSKDAILSLFHNF